MYRANARRLALRLLFIHYYSCPRCKIRLPARKRANETLVLRNAAAPRNLARARRDARAHARVHVRLSCEYIATIYSLVRCIEPRTGRLENYAALAARARYETQMHVSCA